MGINPNGTRIDRRSDFRAASRTSSRFTRRSTPGKVIEAATISFTAPATIADSGNGLGIFAVNDVIHVGGSASNNRRHRILTVAAGSITVDPGHPYGGVKTEGAGATVRITIV